MSLNSKLLFILALVISIPLTLNLALSTQVLKQQAAMGNAISVTYRAAVVSPICQPMPPQCKPGSNLGIVCPAPPTGGWCPTVSVTPHPVSSLSCADCQGQMPSSSLCFSKSQKRSYCSNNAVMSMQPGDVVCVNCVTKPGVTSMVTPTCVPMPPQCKPGSHLGIMCPVVPLGGWCSSAY